MEGWLRGCISTGRRSQLSVFFFFFFFFQHVDKLLLSVIVDGGEVMILLSSGGYVDKLREYRPKIHSREPGLPVPLFNSFSYFYC